MGHLWTLHFSVIFSRDAREQPDREMTPDVVRQSNVRVRVPPSHEALQADQVE